VIEIGLHTCNRLGLTAVQNDLIDK
jgi:hypothetical protein